MDDILQLLERHKIDLKNKMKNHALQNNIRFNQDEKIVDDIINKLLIRKRKHGDFFCPSVMVTENTNLICPCSNHLKDIQENGKCNCGLFIK